MGDALDHTAIRRVVIHHMIRGIILTEMILHRGIGMRHGDVVVLLITRQSTGLEEQFEIHHIVDDHGKLPTVGCSPTPTADTSYGLIIAGDERVGGLYDHIPVRLFTGILPRLAKRVIHHKA